MDFFLCLCLAGVGEASEGAIIAALGLGEAIWADCAKAGVMEKRERIAIAMGAMGFMGEDVAAEISGVQCKRGSVRDPYE